MRENSETRTVGPRGTHPDGVRWGNAALLALPKSVCVLEELRSTLLSYRENFIVKMSITTNMFQYPHFNSISVQYQ